MYNINIFYLFILLNSDNKRGLNLNFKTISSVFFIFLLTFITNCTTSTPVDLVSLDNPADNTENLELIDEIKGTFKQETNSTNEKKQTSPEYSTLLFEQEEIKTMIEDQNLEITEIKAEINILKTEINKISAYKELWSDPFSVYDKKIIMNNYLS